MITPRMEENARKIAFLIQQYPENDLKDTISLLGMPSIDINVAIWLATEKGYIAEPDEATGKVKFLSAPDAGWKFGDVVQHLCESVLYSFSQLAKKETDLEEEYFKGWINGYTPHDVLIAKTLLLNEKKLVEYVIEDGENAYTFYTLYKNRKSLWGRKQFKKDPLEAGDKSAKEQNRE